MLQALNLTIRRGETVNLPIRIESDVWVFKAISAVPQTAPLRLTVTGHGMPDGWRAGIMNMKGPIELNAEHNPPRDNELRRASAIDANTVEFNSVNAAGYRPYVSGGQLAFCTPLDLSLYTVARMTVKDKVGGTELASFSTADDTLRIDTTATVLWLQLTDAQSEALDFAKGVFDLELIDGAGDVTAVCSVESVLTVLPEITT